MTRIELPSDDRRRLANHLEHCEFCRGAQDRFRAAEAAYRDPPPDPLPNGTAEVMVRALLEAAPVSSASPAANAKGARRGTAGEDAPRGARAGSRALVRA